MILLYHLIFPDDTPSDTWNAGKILRLADFKRQIKWLKTYYHILPLDQYMNQVLSGTKPRRSTAITFDDGYQGVFDLISPYLESEQIPATFFANTVHLLQPQLLWFVYFNALCFEKVYKSLKIEDKTYPLNSERNCLLAWQTLINLARASGNAIAFSKRYSQYYPLPDVIIDKYMGMREDQIKQIGSSQVLVLGAHTHSHPYLDQISFSDQLEEMLQNKRVLERIVGKPVSYFAYTGGIYNLDSLTAVKTAGFNAAFVIKPLKLGHELCYEVPRTGIYSASLIKFALKRSGAADSIRRKKQWGE